LGILLLFERDRGGLERHAADRARARPDLAHLRMHRAGIDRVGIGGRTPAARSRVSARMSGFSVLVRMMRTVRVISMTAALFGRVVTFVGVLMMRMGMFHRVPRMMCS